MRSQEEEIHCKSSSPTKSYIRLRKPKFGLRIEFAGEPTNATLGLLHLWAMGTENFLTEARSLGYFGACHDTGPYNMALTALPGVAGPYCITVRMRAGRTFLS